MSWMFNPRRKPKGWHLAIAPSEHVATKRHSHAPGKPGSNADELETEWMDFMNFNSRPQCEMPHDVNGLQMAGCVARMTLNQR